MIKKLLLSILFGALILNVCGSCATADGFSNNPEQINHAAQSVMMLEIYDKNGDIIKTGSGFVAFDNRHLVTNYHVANMANMIFAYSDAGDPYIIQDVCIANSEKDIAILQFFSPTDLEPLMLNDNGEVQRASAVVAIGSPQGFSNTISTGIVSSVFEESGCSYIQFTAPISNGSSGGALFNDEGKVIGVTSMIFNASQGISQNLNFAVNICEVINLYSMWNDKKVKLSDIEDVDISITQEKSSPVSFSTPTPAPTRAPESKKGKQDDGELVRAIELAKHVSIYTGKKVKILEPWTYLSMEIRVDDLIIHGYRNAVTKDGDDAIYIDCIIRNYRGKDFGTGKSIDKTIPRIDSFTVSGVIIGTDYSYVATPIIEVETFDFKLK